MASEGNYNIEDGTITSTLTFDSLTTQDTDTYTCYVEFGDSESVEAEAQLGVNGMLRLLYCRDNKKLKGYNCCQYKIA